MSVNPKAGGSRARSGGSRTAVAGAVIALVLGVLLALAGVGAIIGGAVSAALVSQQEPDGYLNSPTGKFSASSYALTSPPARIGTESMAFDLGNVRFTAKTPAPDGQIFVGIGPKADVERYLSGVHTTDVIGVQSRPFRVQYRDVPGSGVPQPPSSQRFWAVSASGPGTQQITTELGSGDWVLVIMNPDASAGISADVQVATNSVLLDEIPPGLWISGIIALVIGAGLIALGAVLLGRGAHPIPTGVPPVAARNFYPVRITGNLDPKISRGLWLVKWILAIPHVVILFFLWFAVAITTVVAGVVIVFTGHYPRPLFTFAVGVLRWNWRVAFYSYSALATDKYPPFTLASTDYPADLEVDYPQKLSHGLVLVKGWLLAIPHLLIVSVFISTAWASWGNSTNTSPGEADTTWVMESGRSAGFSLLGLLVLIAALILLFTGRYQRSIFDLVMGINRWVYRVAAYVLLLRDEYPPFRLDQGPEEPETTLGPASGIPEKPPENQPAEQ